MQSVEKLLEKFWNGQISETEEEILLQLLKEQEKEFDNLPQPDLVGFTGNMQAEMTEDKAASLLHQIHARINAVDDDIIKQPAKLVWFPKRKLWWVAASAIFLVATGILVFLQPFSRQNKLAEQNLTRLNTVEKTIVNTTGKIEKVNLLDGSVVMLGPNSSVSYPVSFNTLTRDIRLSGEATFKVAKNKSKPFTVYANGIATTALGTEFNVNGLINHTVCVTLFEGKVVIRTTGSGKDIMAEPVFLEPGQQFTINSSTRQYLVRNVTIDREETRTRNKITDATIGKTKGQNTGDANRLTFDHEVLASVFRRLNRIYNVEIRFDEKDIDGLYFSGTVLKNDSLTSLLSAICNMNQLLLTEKQGYFQVSKIN